MTNLVFALCYVLLISINSRYSVEAANPCQPRRFQHDSVVCVCSESYCDTLDPITPTKCGILNVYESDRAGKRLEKRDVQFGNDLAGVSFRNVTINRNQKYQEIIGFGTSWSDAAAIGLNRLSPSLRTKVLRSYFSDEGIEYSTARVVISGCDFSNRPYTYDDVAGDWELNEWALVEEDLQMKFPQMKEALEHASEPIKFIGSSWSPPAWMKNNGKLNNGGQLLAEAGSYQWKQYAKYLLKFFESYKNNGLPFWGMTIQNEPMTGWDEYFPWNTCGFNAEMERDFAKLDLGPVFEAAGFPPKSFHILALDHNRPLAKDWADVVLNDTVASRYVAGLALHWYFYGTAGPYSVYDDIHDKFPNKILLATEACNRNDDGDDPIGLGLWALAEDYAHDILLNLLHRVQGWIDWNMVLDMEGGPNWVGNTHSAPIIVNPEAGEFYKNTQYYSMAHFSKFLPPGTVRIGGMLEEEGKLELGAFERPDGGTVVVVINTYDQEQYFNLNDPDVGDVRVKVGPHSFNSMVYYAKECSSGSARLFQSIMLMILMLSALILSI